SRTSPSLLPETFPRSPCSMSTPTLGGPASRRSCLPPVSHGSLNKGSQRQDFASSSHTGVHDGSTTERDSCWTGTWSQPQTTSSNSSTTGKLCNDHRNPLSVEDQGRISPAMSL